uniref:Golgi-associated plant pathogenesis-related protein 1 n=2 Tax=Zeugodacus cucurbitae TaxID=28588 RepID=A0A0A1XNF2_ZEUCU
MATVKRTVIIKQVPAGGAPNQPPPKPITISQADFEKGCLEAHNKFRAMHGTPAISINPNLTQVAAKWAQNLAKRQKMEHSPNGKYGENIYYSSGQQVTPEMPAKMWYDEIAKYDFAKAQFNPYTGHFTQLIWRDTKQVGVAYATSGEKVWVVANYDPPGNVNGFFKDNVPPKK